MTRYLFQMLILICLCGCFDYTNNRKNKTGEKQFGLYIENGPRQGFQYFDSANTAYNYRYYTITLTNDTIVPIYLQINFNKADIQLSEQLQSKIFLLPRHLTPKKQHMDHTITKELKRFLDAGIDTPLQLNKIVEPAEKCVLTFGVLTDTKYIDPTTPYSTKLLISNEKLPALTMKLHINDSLIIPCGQFSYINK